MSALMCGRVPALCSIVPVEGIVIEGSLQQVSAPLMCNFGLIMNLPTCPPPLTFHDFNQYH